MEKGQRSGSNRRPRRCSRLVKLGWHVTASELEHHGPGLPARQRHPTPPLCTSCPRLTRERCRHFVVLCRSPGKQADANETAGVGCLHAGQETGQQRIRMYGSGGRGQATSWGTDPEDKGWSNWVFLSLRSPSPMISFCFYSRHKILLCRHNLPSLSQLSRANMHSCPVGAPAAWSRPSPEAGGQEQGQWE